MQPTPQFYRDYMWIATWGIPHETTVDGAPTGPKGRVYGCTEVGRAKKVPWEAGRFLIEHCAYTGVVRVEESEREDGTGTDLNLTKAQEESLANFVKGDEEMWQRYLDYIVDRIERKMVVPPMPDSVRGVMQRRHYSLNLSDFVTNITGTRVPTAASTVDNGEVAELRALVAKQAAAIAALTTKLDDALGEPVAVEEPKKKGK